MTALGQTEVNFHAELNNDIASFTSFDATGPNVCVDSNGISTFNDMRPYIHIGGPVYSWEQCKGSYSGSDGS